MKLRAPTVRDTTLLLPFKVHNPYLVAAVATIGALLFGFDISSVSAFIGNKHYKSYFGNPSAMNQAGITSSMPAGSFAGSLFSGWLSDKYGRRWSIQLSSWIWMIGVAIQTASQNMVQLCFGRIIAGFAIGIASSQVPVYISELAPKHVRGMLVGCFQWAVTWGILIMFYISYGCGFINGPTSFRLAWGIMMVPGAMLLLGTSILEESPRWLAAKGQWEECERIITAIHRRKDDPENLAIKHELEEIREVVRLEDQNRQGIVDIMKNFTNIRRLFVGVFCQIWQQLTGMNVMMYYVVNIFTMAGFGGDTLLISSSAQYIINVGMTVPALFFIDHAGRRPVLFFGAIIMCAWLCAMAAILSIYSVPTGPDGYEGNTQVRIYIPKSSTSASKGAIGVSMLFVATFACTWGPAAWVYCSELYPLEQRAVANGISTSANWLFNMAISLFSPQSFVSITWKTYIIFAVFCGAMAIHVFLMFPETQGRTLEEIDLMWKSGVPAWKSRKWRPSTATGGDDSFDEKGHIEQVSNHWIRLPFFRRNRRDSDRDTSTDESINPHSSEQALVSHNEYAVSSPELEDNPSSVTAPSLPTHKEISEEPRQS